ncbi:hypothetical protein SOMG_03538 [Schizosaccharomyces osmophilus]|uniref:Uncharacterized protein n=1 Tax=Schizosaccharomyces osmophilus TaxID=2545709 RepID=A0AAE9WC76_9SCHI|nr:uncharacterized protein SOMG_03538 [Schizosaccharomyces osmophilus]WBW73631.1 hypothetical protein SOMG_03538 [Schizosaccharomyces osmophilus]
MSTDTAVLFLTVLGILITGIIIAIFGVKYMLYVTSLDAFTGFAVSYSRPLEMKDSSDCSILQKNIFANGRPIALKDSSDYSVLQKEILANQDSSHPFCEFNPSESLNQYVSRSYVLDADVPYLSRNSVSLDDKYTEPNFTLYHHVSDLNKDERLSLVDVLNDNRLLNKDGNFSVKQVLKDYVSLYRRIRSYVKGQVPRIVSLKFYLEKKSFTVQNDQATVHLQKLEKPFRNVDLGNISNTKRLESSLLVVSIFVGCFAVWMNVWHQTSNPLYFHITLWFFMYNVNAFMRYPFSLLLEYWLNRNDLVSSLLITLSIFFQIFGKAFERSFYLALPFYVQQVPEVAFVKIKFILAYVLCERVLPILLTYLVFITKSSPSVKRICYCVQFFGWHFINIYWVLAGTLEGCINIIGRCHSTKQSFPSFYAVFLISEVVETILTNKISSANYQLLRYCINSLRFLCFSYTFQIFNWHNLVDGILALVIQAKRLI